MPDLSQPEPVGVFWVLSCPPSGVCVCKPLNNRLGASEAGRFVCRTTVKCFVSKPRSEKGHFKATARPQVKWPRLGYPSPGLVLRVIAPFQQKAAAVGIVLCFCQVSTFTHPLLSLFRPNLLCYSHCSTRAEFENGGAAPDLPFSYFLGPCSFEDLADTERERKEMKLWRGRLAAAQGGGGGKSFTQQLSRKFAFQNVMRFLGDSNLSLSATLAMNVGAACTQLFSVLDLGPDPEGGHPAPKHAMRPHD